MTNLILAIDPGFDSMKVIANGRAFKIPFSVTETDERKLDEYAIGDDFLLYKDKVGTTFRVGQYARELIFSNKETADKEMADFYTEARFISERFSVGMDVAIAKAIELNGLYGCQDLCIHVIIALPHSCRDKFASTVSGKLAGQHEFTLRMGKGVEKAYSFYIQSDNIETVSQTIAAILGETSNEFGHTDKEKAYYLTQGPTLVLDGGYYTMGMVSVSRGGSVDRDKSGSDTYHAMKNVNMDVANKIADIRPDVKHYVVEYLLSKDEGKIRGLRDGKVETIDLNIIKKESIATVSKSFINLLNEKYNSLLDFRYVLITGGTGASFYEHLKEFYVGTGIIPEEQFLLTSGALEGETHDIEYAIAVGAYKGLKGKLGIKNRPPQNKG